MNISYEKCGDYLVPNLIPNSESEGELRKFGLMRKRYLQNHKRGIYAGLLLSGELKEHLLMIQEQAEERFDLLVEQMAEKEGVTEQSAFFSLWKEAEILLAFVRPVEYNVLRKRYREWAT